MESVSALILALVAIAFIVLAGRFRQRSLDRRPPAPPPTTGDESEGRTSDGRTA